jgi:hypothetical protein
MHLVYLEPASKQPGWMTTGKLDKIGFIDKQCINSIKATSWYLVDIVGQNPAKTVYFLKPIMTWPEYVNFLVEKFNLAPEARDVRDVVEQFIYKPFKGYADPITAVEGELKLLTEFYKAKVAWYNQYKDVPAAVLPPDIDDADLPSRYIIEVESDSRYRIVTDRYSGRKWRELYCEREVDIPESDDQRRRAYTSHITDWYRDADLPTISQDESYKTQIKQAKLESIRRQELINEARKAGKGEWMAVIKAIHVNVRCDGRWVYEEDPDGFKRQID